MSEQTNPLMDALNHMNDEGEGAPGHALLHGNDSFPVLKAFQDYMEAERRKMRQRTTLVVSVVVAASLAILVTLVVSGMILFSGMNDRQQRMNDSQQRLLEGLVGIGARQERPVPAPVVPASVAREFEEKVSGEFGRAVEAFTKSVETMQREMKTTVATEHTFETSKAYAVMLDMQEQLKSITGELNTLREKPAAPARQREPVISPVLPRENFPDLDERWAQINSADPQPVEEPPALPPGMREIPRKTLREIEPRPLKVIEPAKPVAQETPAAPANETAAALLQLEFLKTAGAGAQPATLSLPASDGATTQWRLVVP